MQEKGTVAMPASVVQVAPCTKKEDRKLEPYREEEIKHAKVGHVYCVVNLIKYSVIVFFWLKLCSLHKETPASNLALFPGLPVFFFLFGLHLV